MSEYTSLLKICWRVFHQTPLRLLWKFCWNFCWPNLWNMRHFEQRQQRGEPFFPAFNMISVTEACNLACSGCWVSQGGHKHLTTAQIDGIIRESKRHGSRFFGILGGEPLLYKGLIDLFCTTATATSNSSPMAPSSPTMLLNNSVGQVMSLPSSA